MRTTPRELYEKLLRLARDPAALPGEKRNAEAAAARLADRHGFQLENVTRQEYVWLYRDDLRRRARAGARERWDWFECDYCHMPMMRAKRSAAARVPRYAEASDPGRERDYCSNKCRQAAYRARKRRVDE